VLQTIVLTVHLLVASLIILLVLWQRGKGAEAGTGFGAGASATVFGARGSANFLSRTTAVLVTLFYVTSLTLAYLAAHRGAPTSLLEQVPEPAATQSVPAPQPQPQPSDTLPQLPAAPEGPADPTPDGSEN
jgi:preprotein translocase subunit SecG